MTDFSEIFPENAPSQIPARFSQIVEMWEASNGQIGDTMSIPATDWRTFIDAVALWSLLQETARPCGLTALMVADREGTKKRKDEKDTEFVKRIVAAYLELRQLPRAQQIETLLREERT